MRVLAVDPGKMTGWADWKGPDGLAAGQMPHFEFLRFAEQLIAGQHVSAVVCEDFIITMGTLKKSRETWSLEQIGCIRYWCDKHRVPLVMQTPAQAKAFSTDDKVQALGWWQPGLEHANDALRHLVLHLVRNRLISPEELR